MNRITVCAVFLGAAIMAAPKTSQASDSFDDIILTSQFILTAGKVSWQSSGSFFLRYNPLTGEPLERPYFPELGTLKYTSAHFSSSNSFEGQLSAWCPNKNCGTLVSQLSYTTKPDDVPLGYEQIYTRTGKNWSNLWSDPELPGYRLPYSPKVTPENGWDVPQIGPIKTIVTHTVESAGFKIQAAAEFTPRAIMQVTETYTPFSTGTYVKNAITTSRAAGYTDEIALASAGAGYVRTLRGTSWNTAGENLNLRNAEYGFYGYAAGASMASGKFISFDESRLAKSEHNGLVSLPVVTSPAGAIGWYLVKQMAKQDIKFGIPWMALLRAPPGQTSSLPATEDFFGGAGTNMTAFWHGLMNGSVDTLGSCLDGEPEKCGFRLEAPTTDPMTPQFLFKETMDGHPVSTSMFGFDAKAGAQILLDPPAHTSYVFATDGAPIMEISIANRVGDMPAGRILFEIDGEVVTREFKGSAFSFLSELGRGVSGFLLYDLDLAMLPDEVIFGITMGESGGALVQILGVTVPMTTPVPEPAVAWLSLAGLCMVRLRKLQAARQPAPPRAEV